MGIGLAKRHTVWVILGLRRVRMSETGGMVILDHREIHFRLWNDGF